MSYGGKQNRTNIQKTKIDKIIKDKRELSDAAVFTGEKVITELSDDEIYEIFSLA